MLCKPVHREQLEATFRLAIEQQRRRRPRGSRHATTTRARACSKARCIASRRSWQRVDLPDGRRRRAAQPLCGLRPREQEVVRLLLQHLRVPAIARRLGISQQTVRNHLKSVFRRTGVRSQQELLDRIALAAASHPAPDAEAAQIGHPPDDDVE